MFSAAKKAAPKQAVAKKGTADIRTRKIADYEASLSKITPLEVMLHTMRVHWDAGEHREACAIAISAALYMHPRLATVDAKIDVDVSVQMTEAERREQARKAILEAFAERPPLIEHSQIVDVPDKSAESPQSYN
jgi:hypothetical protein